MMKSYGYMKLNVNAANMFKKNGFYIVYSFAMSDLSPFPS